MEKWWGGVAQGVNKKKCNTQFLSQKRADLRKKKKKKKKEFAPLRLAAPKVCTDLKKTNRNEMPRGGEGGVTSSASLHSKEPQRKNN